ncbi:MamK family actin-like protein [Deltaproteobacteria bacterium TL4]
MSTRTSKTPKNRTNSFPQNKKETRGNSNSVRTTSGPGQRMAARSAEGHAGNTKPGPEEIQRKVGPTKKNLGGVKSQVSTPATSSSNSKPGTIKTASEAIKTTREAVRNVPNAIKAATEALMSERESQEAAQEQEKSTSAAAPFPEKRAGGPKLLRIGIDLGTAKTALISERGIRTLMPSVVGYPRDIISTKLLNANKAIGEEALKNQSHLNLYYPIEHGVITENSEIDIEAAKDLLQHVLNLAQPEPGDKLAVVIGTPSAASFSGREALLKLAKEMTDVTLVASQPFLVAYGMDRLSQTIVIDIGAGTTNICALTGSIPLPEDQVTLTKAGDSVDMVLRTLISEHHFGIQITQQFSKKIKEKFGFVGETEEPALVPFRENGRPRMIDVTKEVKAACETLITPIVENIQDLLLRFDPEDQGTALQNIFLAGNSAKIKGLDQALAEALAEYGEIHIRRVEDLDYAGCNGALKIATEFPIEHWNQIGDVIGSL